MTKRRRQRLHLRSASGQTAAEYLGVIVVIATIIFALTQANIPKAIGDAIEAQICKVSDDPGQCDGSRAKARERKLDRKRDPDGDGLTTKQERKLGTASDKADTDGDGIPDGDEVKDKTDPKKADTNGNGIDDGDEDRLAGQVTKGGMTFKGRESALLRARNAQDLGTGSSTDATVLTQVFLGPGPTKLPGGITVSADGKRRVRSGGTGQVVFEQRPKEGVAWDQGGRLQVKPKR